MNKELANRLINNVLLIDFMIHKNIFIEHFVHFKNNTYLCAH